MDIIEGLKTRRSVRRFDTTKKIPRADIEKIIAAASFAPSAHNTQPLCTSCNRGPRLPKTLHA